MTSELDALKPCPFCKGAARSWKQGIVRKELCACSNDDCGAYFTKFTPEEWNTRAVSRAEVTPDKVDLREAMDEIKTIVNGEWDNKDLARQCLQSPSPQEDGAVYEYLGKPYSRRMLEEENQRLRAQCDANKMVVPVGTIEDRIKTYRNKLDNGCDETKAELRFAIEALQHLIPAAPKFPTEEKEGVE